MSAVIRVADELRERILSGALVAGARLQQADLAGELQVSRIPVRDALQRLAAEGLVDLHGKAGATVARLSVTDLEELYELRGAVEPLASRLGTPNVGRVDVARMGRLHDQLQHERDPARWIALNASFHAPVYERSRRPRMVELVEHLRRLTDRYLRLHLVAIGQVGHLHAEHEAILRAVERCDAIAVQMLTAHHLATSHDFVLSYLLEHALDTADASGGLVGERSHR